MTRASTPPARRRRLLMPALILLALGAVAAYLVWWLFLAGDAPASASINQAAGVVASEAPASTASSTATSAGAGSAADGIGGSWTVDASIGSFADYTSAWAGFRVDEVLGQGIGETTAIGRTPGVTGTLAIDGQTLTAAQIEVDLTTISTDRPRRDDAIQRALETSAYPSATFVLTEPVDLGGVPAEGETVTVEAIGDLTIHGFTQSIAFPLEAQRVDDTIVVVGSAPVTFSDFGVEMPSAPIVVSVEDNGILELQLFVTRA